MTEIKARYEVEPGINNCLIIRDGHSSDLTSLTKHALGFLEQQSGNQNFHRTLIVSDIDGDDLANEMFYLNICQVIRSRSVDRIVFIGQKRLEVKYNKVFYRRKCGISIPHIGVTSTGREFSYVTHKYTKIIS